MMNAMMDVLMPQLGETVAEGKITKWFKSAGEAGEAGRQSVRDRDRQGFDGGAVDHDRRAVGDPRSSRRSRSGRRHRRMIADRAGATRASRQRPRRLHRRRGKSLQRPATRSAFDPRRAAAGTTRTRSSSIRSSKCARRRAISARPSWRAAPRSRRSRAGSPPKPGSICRASPAPARTAASSPAISKRAAATASA